jgi:hypothetical protein
MRCKSFSCPTYLLVVFAAMLFMPLKNTFAQPASSNGWHLNSAVQSRFKDLICKVQVVSISSQGQHVKRGTDDPVFLTTGMTARSKVLSVIKGKCSDVIDIEFNYTSGIFSFQDDIKLSEGEVCIVFLKKHESGYRLNRVRSKARIQPNVIDYNLGNTPILRLIDEFLVGCNSDDELVKLQAVEELGYLGDKIIDDFRDFRRDKELSQAMISALMKIKAALRKTNSCPNLVIRNISIMSCFKADESPDIILPLELLRSDPNEFDMKSSREKYGIREFSIEGLQLKLLETMDSSTRRAVFNLEDGSKIRREDGGRGMFRGVRNFDYALFFKEALKCKSVIKSEKMRRAIANVIWIRYEKKSVPEMIQLLDDSFIHIRSTAVSALRKCINSDFSNFGEGKPLEERKKDYAENEQRHIQYWKQWWLANKSNMESS